MRNNEAREMFLSIIYKLYLHQHTWDKMSQGERKLLIFDWCGSKYQTSSCGNIFNEARNACFPEINYKLSWQYSFQELMSIFELACNFDSYKSFL